MTELITKTILVIEKDPAVAALARTTLTSAGYEVLAPDTPEQALKKLETSEETPVGLLICGLDLDDTDGAAVLEKANAISPLTQRMLLVPADDPKALVHAVNTAEIHACLTYPLNRYELTAQAGKCLEAAGESIKQAQFKKLITRHNQKMYNMARSLKKKDKTSRALLEEKKSRRIRLKFEERKLKKRADLKEDFTLDRLLERIDIPRDPDQFQALFEKASSELIRETRRLAEAHQIQWETPDLVQVIDNKLPGYSHPQLVDGLIKEIYKDVHDAYQAQPGPEPETQPDKETQEAPEAAPGNEKDSRALSVEECIEMIEDYLELTLREKEHDAVLKKKKDPESDNFLTLDNVLEFIHSKGICFGLVPDEVIEEWVQSGTVADGELPVASPKLPVFSKDGSVEYLFEIDYTNPGKVRDDGSIDFHDRGDVPFVRKGDLLAKKTPPVQGESGISILGTEIQIQEPVDPSFSCGHGAMLSDDGTHIYSAINGQPHLDAMGKITVNPEFVVKGDVDFETGNIDFDGNIVVRGTIKQGFRVKGVSLTANEIEGATIELTGDLNVSSGITGAKIKTVGNIHTKFIHDSTILGFGNFIVQKEIIDSEIALSGSCDISSGHIIASDITAKAGILAGRTGTPATRPPVLKVGVEDHIQRLLTSHQDAIKRSVEQIRTLREEIKALKEKNLALEKDASENAHIQDTSQVKIRELKKKLAETPKTSPDFEALKTKIRELSDKAGKAGEQLKIIFGQQERLDREVKVNKDRIKLFEKDNIKRVTEKKALEEHSGKIESDACVTALKDITQGTRIQGISAAITLKEDLKKCRIHEALVTESGKQYHEMRITPLND